MMELGDLTVLADDLPPKMLKALAAISLRAHAAYEECSGFPPGTSYDKCLFMSLAIRDFLVEVGFTDATIRTCCLFIRADDLDGKQIWSVGIGVPGEPDIFGKFNAHAVVYIPSLELLIDTTVYQAVRPHWAGAITGMVAAPCFAPRDDLKLYGLTPFAGGEDTLADRVVTMLWLDRPEVNWRRDPDFRTKNNRRRCVTKALREAFGVWQEPAGTGLK